MYFTDYVVIINNCVVNFLQLQLNGLGTLLGSSHCCLFCFPNAAAASWLRPADHAVLSALHTPQLHSKTCFYLAPCAPVFPLAGA